jgi:hypothetical protein
MDSAGAAAFVWDAMQRGLIVFETLTLDEYRIRSGATTLVAGAAGAETLPVPLSADAFEWTACDVFDVVPEESHAEVAPATAHAEMEFEGAHAEGMPAEAHAEVMPAEAYAEVIPAEAYAEVIPAETHADVMPAEAQAEVIPAEAHAEVMPVETHTDAMPAQTHAEIMPAEKHAETVPAEALGEIAPARTEPVPAEASVELVSAEAHADMVAAEMLDETVPGVAHGEAVVTAGEPVEALGEAYHEAPVHVELGPESQTEDTHTFLYDSDLAAADLEAFDEAHDSTEPVAFDSSEPVAFDSSEPVAFDSTEPVAFDSTEPSALDAGEDLAFDDDAGGISLSFSGDDRWDQPAATADDDKHEPERVPVPVASAPLEPLAQAAEMNATARDERSDDADELASARSWKESLSWREQEALREAKDAGGDRSTLLGSLLRTLGVH